MQIQTRTTFVGILCSLGWVATLLALTSCESPKPVPVTIPGAVALPTVKAAISGKPQHVAAYYYLNPDCTSVDLPVVRILAQPAHGSVSIEDASGYTWYGKDNQRFECNKQKSPMRQIVYTSAPDFVGPDTFKISVLYADGNLREETFNVTVN